MKKYNVYIYYYEDDDMYVAVCPDFFNFILYHNNAEELHNSIVNCLQIYSNDYNINEGNINYIKDNKEELLEKDNKTNEKSFV